MNVNRIPKPFLDFDDAGASDDEPAKGVTAGDIRAWHDKIEGMQNQIEQLCGYCQSYESDRHELHDLVEKTISEVIFACREQGETDLRSVKSRISTALSKMLEPPL